jgi:hypothetical protein
MDCLNLFGCTAGFMASELKPVRVKKTEIARTSLQLNQVKFFHDEIRRYSLVKKNDIGEG